jgi:hypothetical protein
MAYQLQPDGTWKFVEQAGTTGQNITPSVTPTPTAGEMPTDMTSGGMFKQQQTLAQQIKDYQTSVATNAAKAQRDALATEIEKNQRLYQQARQQISEDAFTRDRALLQGASQRGLGGSGIEQLAKTQQRMQTGQQISGLTQEQASRNQQARQASFNIEESLRNAFSQSALQQQGALTAAQQQLITGQARELETALKLQDRDVATQTRINNEARQAAIDLWTKTTQQWDIEDRASFVNAKNANNTIGLVTGIGAYRAQQLAEGKPLINNDPIIKGMIISYFGNLPKVMLEELVKAYGITGLTIPEDTAVNAGNLGNTGGPKIGDSRTTDAGTHTITERWDGTKWETISSAPKTKIGAPGGLTGSTGGLQASSTPSTSASNSGGILQNWYDATFSPTARPGVQSGLVGSGTVTSGPTPGIGGPTARPSTGPTASPGSQNYYYGFNPYRPE